jgi:hypothetical protein
MKETYGIMDRNVLMNAVFLSFVCIVWTIAVAWIIYSCHHDCDDRLNVILSNKYWALISQIGLSLS